MTKLTPKQLSILKALDYLGEASPTEIGCKVDVTVSSNYSAWACKGLKSLMGFC